MYMPFGLSGFTPPDGGQGIKWNIDFALKGYNEPDNYVNKFYNFLLAIETRVIENICEDSVRIFGSKQSMHSLRDKFTSNLKQPTAKYEPKFRVKVDTETDGESMKISVFDSENNPIFEKPQNALFARKSGTAIIELDSVYFMNKKFGLVWRMRQLKIFEPQNLKGFQFAASAAAEPDGSDDGEDEDEENNNQHKKITGFMFSTV
jgi:hypothetical protein